jgi:hypothetical protein
VPRGEAPETENGPEWTKLRGAQAGRPLLLSAEESHHLADVEEPVDEEDEVQDDVEHGTKFDVLTSEHGRGIQMGAALVKKSIALEGAVLKFG